MDIRELVHLIQSDNNESAFNELYKQQIRKLSQFAYSFLNDKETSEEIVNDIFLKIWLNRKMLDQIRNIQVYLYISVKNACLNHIRGTSSKKNKELDLPETFYFQFSPDPSQLLIGKELQAEILKSVNSLPPRCKLIFKMVKEDGLTCKEIANILNLSNKTVFAQLAIALTKIESLIK